LLPVEISSQNTAFSTIGRHTCSDMATTETSWGTSHIFSFLSICLHSCQKLHPVSFLNMSDINYSIIL